MGFVPPLRLGMMRDPSASLREAARSLQSAPRPGPALGEATALIVSPSGRIVAVRKAGQGTHA